MSETRPIQVLVVDDESSLVEELSDFLTLTGAKVISAGDGAEALSVLAAHPEITVVLTDIRMPNVDGLTLTNRILQSHAESEAVEVVLMTGHGTLDNAAEAVRAGAFDFMRKPMELNDVLAVLRRAHTRAVNRREAYAAHEAERSCPSTWWKF